MSMTIICAPPGAGKTAYISLLQYNAMFFGRKDYLCAKHEINYLKQNGFSKVELPPQKHLCFSDYNFKINKRFENYKINGYEIGLTNPYFKTVFFPVGSWIFLDEAQRYFDSRMSLFLREEVYRWFQLHRHNGYKIFMTAQRLANIDINIRAIADEFIVIDKLEIKHDCYGRVKKIIWYTSQFISCEVAEQYQLAKEKGEMSKLGKKVKVETDLNIFKYYDSMSNKPVFYNISQRDLEYDYFTEQGYSFSMKGICEFNTNNYFVAPKGYYKKQRV